MKILVVSQYFWPETFHINDVVRLLGESNSVDVLTGKPNYPYGKFFEGYKFHDFPKEFYAGATIYRIPITPRRNNAFFLIVNYIAFVFSSILFAPWILRAKKYDVIFVYGLSPVFQVLSGSFLGWLKGAPVVLWVQDLWPESVRATGYVKSNFLIKILTKLVKFSYSNTDLILVQSLAFRNEVAKLAPEKEIAYHPNSVSEKFFSPLDIRCPKISAFDSGFNILFAGNVGRAQSVETLVETAKLLTGHPEIKIIILGDGSKLDWISTQIEIFKLKNIRLEGRYPVEMMPHLMRRASVLLVSLKNEYIFNLTIPTKIQAYLAVGKPIIGCLNGAGASLIDDAQAGISVPAEDARGLAEAIIKLYQASDSDRSKMGENARAYFKANFDQEMLTAKLINHFRGAIKKWNVRKRRY